MTCLDKLIVDAVVKLILLIPPLPPTQIPTILASGVV